jgi:hypothetical protein
MRETTRVPAGQVAEGTVNHPRIDEGKTRFEENEERKVRNRKRELEVRAWGGGGRTGPARMVTRSSHGAGPFNQPIGLTSSIIASCSELRCRRNDSDPVVASLREPLEERKAEGKASAWQPDREPNLRPFEQSAERSGRHEAMSARGGPYAAGPGKPINERDGRMEVDLPGPRQPADHSTDRAPRRDAGDRVAGAGLAVIRKSAESLESKAVPTAPRRSAAPKKGT